MSEKRVGLWPRLAGLLCLSLTLGVGYSSHAQATLVPIVTIHATDPSATWSDETGTFTLFRDGPTNATLNVYFVTGGTASNGVDYATLGNWVTIPAGVRTNTITMAPINHGQTNFATVVAKLVPSPLMPPINYMIGYPDSAVVFISPGPLTNFPPWVAIASPPNGAKFLAPAEFPICASAGDHDGYVSTVQFFAGDHSLGIRTNNPISAGPMNPFCLVWSNAPAGDYLLKAVATDNDGATSVSPAVLIHVLPPPTNYPPLVRITSPPNGAFFRAPVDIPIFAYASEPGGHVAAVQFFQDTNSLGFGQGLCATADNHWPVCPTNIFRLVWSNAPLGTYVLTAQATDDAGVISTSPPVKVTILSAPPPPTNHPPIVSIGATDPIAIEGTNCWPWLGLATAAPTWNNWTNPGASWHYFTNCGPKNATFVVRRYGATNDDLVVSYAIGGTATNGVDYVPLSGSVTIPAGERRAAITLIPLDDGPPDINSTVVLHLMAGTNYVVGWPHSAGAIILDSFGPFPRTGLLPDRCFHLSVPGPDGAWFHVDYSTDLQQWTSICTNQVVNGLIEFIDPDAQSDQARFYRAVPEANPPAD